MYTTAPLELGGMDLSGKRVGGEVDSYCTKCRMMLAHTIIAMVGEKIARVQCNTCMGQHAHRAQPPGTAKKKAATEGTTRRRTSKKEVETLPFESLFEGADVSQARTYSPRERFEEKEIVNHPTFGLGLVETARDDKIDIVFKMGQKTLIHGRAPGA